MGATDPISPIRIRSIQRMIRKMSIEKGKELKGFRDSKFKGPSAFYLFISSPLKLYK